MGPWNTYTSKSRIITGMGLGNEKCALSPETSLCKPPALSFLICKMGNVSRLHQNGTERIKQSNPILLLHRENFKITKGFYIDTWQPSEQPRVLLSPFFNWEKNPRLRNIGTHWQTVSSVIIPSSGPGPITSDFQVLQPKGVRPRVPYLG